MRLASKIKKGAYSTLVAGLLFTGATALDQLLTDAGYKPAFVASAEAQGAQERRRTPAMSEKLYKQLAEVAEYASPPEDSGKKPDFQAALKEVRKVEKNCSKCNEYEFAQIYNYYGWIYYSLDDMPNAIKYYKKVVAQSPNISIGLEVSTLDTIAKLSFSLDQYQDALDYHDKWMKLATLVTADAFAFRAQVYYQMKKRKDAQNNINRAIKMVEDKGDIAKEPYYSLQRALYIEKEDYKLATANLEKVVRHYPKKSYWIQLSGLYGLLEKSDRQLHSMDTAYLQGAVDKEQQIINLAYLYLGQEYPYRAAKVLEQGIKDKKIKETEKNLDLLARSWSQAKETKKAIPVMSKAAAMSDSGDLYSQLASLYLDADESKNAVAAGEKALKKGNLKREGEVHVNMGIAYMDLKNYGAAVKAFKEAMKDKRTRRFATNWLRYAENEYSRDRQLKKANG